MQPDRTALVGTFGPRSADEMRRVLAEPEAARCDLVELRLDLVPEARDEVAALIDASPVAVLATCRRASDGGGFEGGEDERLALLAAAAEEGAEWVDVEHDVPAAAVDALAGARILRSIHVDRLPQDLEALVAALLAPPCDAAKLVALHGDDRDALRMLSAVAAGRGRLAGHVVERPFTRFASCLLGAPLAYAKLRPGGRIGLPIPTVPEMLDVADLARARRGTRAWVLIGGDVERSVSPQMLNRAFRGGGHDVVALRWSAADPRPALAAIRAFGWAGAAVTIPHKETVHRLLAERGAHLGVDAEATGAVNTVLRRGDALVGENTDVGGLLDALEPELNDDVVGAVALVLGAGGAARAAVLAARRLGLSVLVHARRPEEAAALQALGAVVAPDAAEALAAGPRVVIDATPAGAPGEAPFVDPALLPAPALVMDMLVAGRPTAILAAAAKSGHIVVPGLAMLAAQAARQVELLTGAEAQAGAMRAVGEILLHLRERRVVLLGLRCTGKSAVGARLADLLARRFVDTDNDVEERLGRSPDDLIRSGDEAAFRAAERETLLRLSTVPDVVVATGGGAALAGDALDALCRDAFVVLLEASDEVLRLRLLRAPRAPLTALGPAEELVRQRSERMPMYESRCAHTELTDARDEQETAESIAAWLVRETTAPVRASSVPS